MLLIALLLLLLALAVVVYVARKLSRADVLPAAPASGGSSHGTGAGAGPADNPASGDQPSAPGDAPKISL